MKHKSKDVYKLVMDFLKTVDDLDDYSYDGGSFFELNMELLDYMKLGKQFYKWLQENGDEDRNITDTILKSKFYRVIYAKNERIRTEYNFLIKDNKLVIFVEDY